MYTAINQRTDELVFESKQLGMVEVMVDTYQRNVLNEPVAILAEDGSIVTIIPARQTKYPFTRVGVHVRVHPDDRQAVLDYATERTNARRQDSFNIKNKLRSNQ